MEIIKSSIQKEKTQNIKVIKEKNTILKQEKNTIALKLKEQLLNLCNLEKQIACIERDRMNNKIAIHDNETEILNLHFENGLTSCKLSEQMLTLIESEFRNAIDRINFNFHEETFDVIVNMEDRKLKYTFGNDDMFIKMLDTIRITNDVEYCKKCCSRVIIEIGEDQKETYCAVCDAHEMPFGPPKIIDDDKIQLDHDSRCTFVKERVKAINIPDKIMEWKLVPRSTIDEKGTTFCDICRTNDLIHAFSKKDSDFDVCFNCMIALYAIKYEN